MLPLNVKVVATGGGAGAAGAGVAVVDVDAVEDGAAGEELPHAAAIRASASTAHRDFMMILSRAKVGTSKLPVAYFIRKNARVSAAFQGQNTGSNPVGDASFSLSATASKHDTTTQGKTGESCPELPTSDALTLSIGAGHPVRTL
jgi:hypothetical protein